MHGGDDAPSIHSHVGMQVRGQVEREDQEFDVRQSRSSSSSSNSKKSRGGAPKVS